MSQNFASAGVYLIQTLMGLFILIVCLRLLIQAVRADFYNPISQGVIRLTDPILKPMRRYIPSYRNIDLSAIILALALQMLQITLILLLIGSAIPNPLTQLLWSILGLGSLILNIYYFALIIMVIVSWVAPHGNHPAITLIYQIVEPVCAPARRLLPPMGGLDLSIILVFVTITLIDSFLVIPPLQILLGVPSGLMFGL